MEEENSNEMIVDENGSDETGSDDDSDLDDDLIDEESQTMKTYIEILQKLEENKYNYDDYIALVDTAYKLNDLDKIRQSYELFSSIYPLSPDIWLKWLEIEQNTSTSNEEIENVIKLYKRALGDYWSTTVALEYGKFISKLENFKELWNEILPKYSLSCFDGGKLFELWRNDFLKSFDDSLEKIDQLKEMYEKELKLPLNNMENSYIEFKVLMEKHKEKYSDYDWETFNRRYNRAKKALEQILPFEKKLKDLDPKLHKERAELYLNYIKECEDCLEDNFLQAIYERMVTECCLNPQVWLEYIKFYDLIHNDDDDELNNSIFPETKLDIVNRGLRNCTWSTELHIKKLRIIESSKKFTKSDYQNAFEQSISFGFDSPNPSVEIWMEYLTYLRKHTNYSDEDEKELLRKNFQFAWDNLGRAWGVLADQNCEILQFWARLEYTELKNPLKGRELFMSVMDSSDNSTKSGLWIEFIELEQTRHIESARKLFKKSISYENLDNVSTIISAWNRFERCHGTIDTLSSCQKRCQEILKSYYTHEKKQMKSLNKKHTTKRGFEEVKEERNKPKEVSDEKRMKFDEDTKDIDPEKDEFTVFVSNLDYDLNESEIADIFKNLDVVTVKLIKSGNGRSRGFGYVEFKSTKDVAKALELDRTLINGRPTFISSCIRDRTKREKFKYSEGIEPTKLFIKGIPYHTTKEELEELFKEFGTIKDIRLVCHKNGKSKGIAYIEYDNEKSASLAVMKMDKKSYEDNVLNVAISAPPPHQNSTESKKLSTMIHSLTSNSKKNLNRDRTMKPRMTLIPQAVQKKFLQNKPQSETKTEITSSKTNDDFRKLLLNKS